MILIISTCEEKLHELEFVKPIEDICSNAGKKFFTRHYKRLTSRDIRKASKIIICGTALGDNEYLKHLDKFSFIKTYEKPVLGICAGIQIIALEFGGELERKKEIGMIKINFKKEFFSFSGEKEVYALHNFSVGNLQNFEAFAFSAKCIQAIKHKEKDIYGVLFHPEVRQKDLIRNFLGLQY